MSDLLTEGLEWLDDELFAHAARPVTYRRGTDSVTVEALIGKLATETLDVEEAQLAYTGRRFLIHHAELDFGMGPITPQRGDQIRLPTPDGKTAVYEVTGYPQGQPKLDRLLEIIAAYLRTE